MCKSENMARCRFRAAAAWGHAALPERVIITLGIFILAYFHTSTIAHCAESAPALRRLFSETAAEKTERLSWWTHDRFGMFIHFGLYAIPARGEWIKKIETIPEAKYDEYFKAFNPDLFDAKSWAKAAKNAGMKYAVLTSRHHDGFCMFDSHFTDYKVTNSPYGKDAVREFLEAFRAEGLKVGLYHSLPDWTHPGYADTESPECIVGGKKEPHVPTPEPLSFPRVHLHLFLSDIRRLGTPRLMSRCHRA